MEFISVNSIELSKELKQQIRIERYKIQVTILVTIETEIQNLKSYILVWEMTILQLQT